MQVENNVFTGLSVAEAYPLFSQIQSTTVRCLLR